MITPIVLCEYESREISLAPAAQRSLALLAGKKLTVSVGSTPATCRVTASQYVGTLVTPECRLLIRPKVGLENIFSLLGIGLPANAWQDGEFAFGGSRDLLLALSHFFARALQQSTSAGLLRAYRGERERLVGIRGRVDLATQVRFPGDAGRIACQYDDYTVDLEENRILKAACRRLLRVSGGEGGVRRIMHEAINSFREVADVPVREEAVDWIRFTRLNRHYESTLRLAQLVLRNLSLLDATGVHGASAFLLDMNELFQRYVTDRLARALSGRLELIPEPDVRLGTRNQIRMYPDLVFLRSGIEVFAGDLKYKLAEDGRGRGSDYYQLLAYLTALDLPRGVLIYCQSSGEAPQRSVTVRHSGKELLTYPLDLTCPHPQLEQKVNQLASWIASLPSSPQTGLPPTPWTA